MIINPDNLSDKDVYKLLTGAVVPRPIAWVSTISKDGVPNLAPYSFFTVVSRKPPTLCISVGEGVRERKETEKDTLVNIREMKDFVINITPLHLANEMHRTSENVAPEINEFESVGLTPISSEMIHSPRIKEAPINIECKLDQIIQVGTDHLILGRMVRYHIEDEMYHNGRVDIHKLNPVGRLAGNYTKIDSIFELPDSRF